jgi:hypothetical protein
VNRPIGRTSDGATVLRPGRHYRLLLVVEGATDTNALAASLAGAGLVGERVGISLPADWSKERPADWPDEDNIALTDAQSLIRVSGPCFARVPVRIEAPTTIEPGAHFRVLDAWDYGEAQGAPPAPAIVKAGAAPKEDEATGRGKKLFFGAVAIAGVAIGWNWLSAKKREERDEERLLKLAERAEREDLSQSMHELMSGGMTRAEAIAAMRASSPQPAYPPHGFEDSEPGALFVRVR